MRARRITLSVDFDATYTADPETTSAAMDLFLEAGHEVIVVTGRGDHHRPTAEKVIGERFDGRVPVIRVYHMDVGDKYEAALKHGYNPDIWWDDQPWHIKPTEERKKKDKEAQRRRSEIAHSVPDDVTFEQYLERLNGVKQ